MTAITCEGHILVRLTKHGEIRQAYGVGPKEFSGILGTMAVPTDTSRRAARLSHRFPRLFDEHEYIAEWCHFNQLKQAQR